MHKIKGSVLFNSTISAMDGAGEALSRLIESAHRATGASKKEPVVIPFWSSMVELPHVGTERAMPLLLISLPESVADDAEHLATAPMALKIVTKAAWAKRVTCLELAGQRHAVQLRTEHILPVLRMVATGTVVFVVVCGDAVLLVEHVFSRRELLEVCSALHQDYLVNDKCNTGNGDLYAEYMYTQSNGYTTWLPVVAMFDRYEEFFYGVVRSQDPQDE